MHSFIVFLQPVALDAPMLSLTLFLGNMPDNLDDAKLREEMVKYGQLERCFIMRNKEGASKVGCVVTHAEVACFRVCLCVHHWLLDTEGSCLNPV